MTTVASTAAGARRATTEHTVTVRLTPDDIKMIRAFVAWGKDNLTCSPKLKYIEFGYGEHRFNRYRVDPGVSLRTDTTGPHTFKRLVALHVIEHSRNGHCWLTDEGKRIAGELQ